MTFNIRGAILRYPKVTNLNHITVNIPRKLMRGRVINYPPSFAI